MLLALQGRGANTVKLLPIVGSPCKEKNKGEGTQSGKSHDNQLLFMLCIDFGRLVAYTCNGAMNTRIFRCGEEKKIKSDNYKLLDIKVDYEVTGIYKRRI